MRYHIATRPLSRILTALAGLALLGAPASAQYVQTNLVSNITGLALHTDLQLTNPWGISSSGTSPFWVSDNGSGVSTLYNGQGVKQGLVVTIPGGVPTGQVFNNAGAFQVAPGGPNSNFIFATENGTIAAWTNSLGTNAITEFTGVEGSSYKGLAIAGSGGTARLYGANFGTGNVDILDGSFTLLNVPGAFTDPNLPAGYAPFNVQNINGNIVVTYAVRGDNGDDVAGAGNGVVDVYDTNGNLLRRLTSGGALNSPWGLAFAPSAFGPLGNTLLIGNFGDGTINAYDFFTGAMRGTIMGPDGMALVNDGLWGLAFGNGNATFDPNSLYLTAGLNDEADGLFARITATPEPGSMALMATGLLGVIMVGRKRRQG